MLIEDPKLTADSLLALLASYPPEQTYTVRGAELDFALRALDLCRVQFENCRLLRLGANTDFRWAKLTDCTVAHARAYRPCFAGARLVRTTFEDCEFRGASFGMVAELQHVTFGGVFTECDFTDVDLRSTRWPPTVSLARTVFEGAHLPANFFACGYWDGVDLRGAHMEEVQWLPTTPHAYLRLRGALATPGSLPGVPRIADLDRQILARISGHPAGPRLDMEYWHHPNKTDHCLAGWACVLAGEAGAELERRTSTGVAGALIYLNSVGAAPDFNACDHDALEELQQRAAEGGTSGEG